MNAIPNNLTPTHFPRYPYSAPNPLPPSTTFPIVPFRATAIGPDGVMRGGNAIPGVSPAGT